MNIYEKISAVMQDVQYLSKDDNIEYKSTRYKAISEEKVTSVVRESLIKNKLVIFPICQEHKKEDFLTTVDVKYRIVNIENPDEFVDVVSSGTGVDTQDKGVGKAMTYAYKYMLLRTFAIPTGEDPDKISSNEMDEKLKKNHSSATTEKNVPADNDRLKPVYDELNRIGYSVNAICKTYKIDDITKMSDLMIREFLKKAKNLPDKESA